MRKQSRRIAAGTLLVLGAGLSAPSEAQDFFSNLFGGFAAPQPALRPQQPALRPQMMLPVDERRPQPRRAPRQRVASSFSSSSSAGQAWCVRTCDGRYFPITGPDAQSKAASCNGFCPASSIEIVYGDDIDHAATSSGKAYSQLPNAFKYRSEVVAGCTCNGKDQAGLAPVPIDKDPTLQKGDIVAGADGLMVAHPGSGKHAELNFTPVPQSVRARFQPVRVMARE